jgi:xanthine dehydrogenase accessory factor
VADFVLVQVSATRGSVPRERGAWMLVGESTLEGTIGGGHMELEAIRAARAMLAGFGATSRIESFTLGPRLGQCCGGAVDLEFRRVPSADIDALRAELSPPVAPLALFGGGHVGTAIVQALAPLPFAVTWIDSREAIFPEQVPPSVTCEHSEPVQGAVAQLAAGSRVLVMSFSHAEDLDIVAACLRRVRERGDLPFIGLIGSRTKWATFRHRLEARGFTDAELARVTCPIGITGIAGKEPPVIAASVVAQILLVAPPPRAENRA